MPPISTEGTAAPGDQGSAPAAPSAVDVIDRLPPPGARVVVAMSGGVDSSVAAALLHARGCEVIGITLSLWAQVDACAPEGGCCTPEDILDAKKVCRILGVPHYLLDYRDAFREQVVDPFLSAWGRGETPNPCVRCNDHLKFDRLLTRARELDAPWLATGHYARVVGGAEPKLIRAADPKKDQSYFVAGMARRALAALTLPLGGLDKEEVRRQAAAFGLPTRDKPDSQDICFVAGESSASFVRRHGFGTGPGLVRDSTGAVVGHHEGLETVTIGQRKGLRTGGGPRRYVTAVDPESNEVRVGDMATLDRWIVAVRDLRWLRDVRDEHLWLQCRAHGRAARIARLEQREGVVVAHLAEPTMAPAAGQAAVLYAGARADEVVAAGTVAIAPTESRAWDVGPSAPG